MEKQLLFSLTSKDFEFQTFCTGGNGGQHRDGRDQRKNKEEAFRKCAETPQFKAWHRVETLKRKGLLKNIESALDEAMRPENLKIEYISWFRFVQGQFWRP